MLPSPSPLSNLERKIHGSYSDDDLQKMTSECIGKGAGPLALGGALWEEAVAGHKAKAYDDHLWDKVRWGESRSKAKRAG